jgi:hypothetical protein
MLSNSNPLPKVHCLVHPGFDYWDHPEFEESVRCYIDHIAYKTNDILLIVSDWESLDNEQRRQWSHIQMLDWIWVFLLLYEPLAGHLLETYDYRWCYSKALINNDLDEKLYNWCKENIDITQLEEITWSMKILRENKRIRDHWFDINNYNLEKDKLCKQWEFFLTTINISSSKSFWRFVSTRYSYKDHT